MYSTAQSLALRVLRLYDLHVICLLLFILGTFLALQLRTATQENSNVPLINHPKWYELNIIKQAQFLFSGIDTLAKAREASKGEPFRLLTNSKEIVVLPPKYAEFISTDARLSFAKYFADEFDGEGKVFGLEPYSLINDPRQSVLKLVKKHVTRSLTVIPVKMSSEANFAVEYNFGSRVEWQEANIHHQITDIIIRLVSRLFWDGDELCRNEAWLDMMKSWMTTSVHAAFMINMAPKFLRPLIRRFSTKVHQASKDYQAARNFIEPLIDKRRAIHRKAREAGDAVGWCNDFVDWIDSDKDDLDCDPVALQMVINAAAVHQTAALVLNTLVFLASDPSTFEPLRIELAMELGNGVCQVSGLNNLRLMDSAIKESLRLKPPGVFGIHRAALEDMQLPNGHQILKGDHVFIDIAHMLDPRIYDTPDSYDMYRFLRMRSQPENAKKAPLVSLHPEHLAFGYGAQACPGRFLAAVLSKVVLAHIVLKYDWQLAPGCDSRSLAIGLTKRVNPNNRLLFRRRRAEIDLQ